MAHSAVVAVSRDSDVEALAEHLRQADVLDPAELRAANQRIREAEGDAAAAAQADDDFHRRLLAGSTNAHLLEVVDLVRNALLSYERLYMLSPERLARSVAEHESIVVALEAGNHALAAERLRENFTSGLPELEDQIREPEES